MIKKVIAVDLDGTLAEYHGYEGPSHIGKVIPKMKERVLQWISNNAEVRIFTSREPLDKTAIVEWLNKNGIPKLKITNIKTFDVDEFWDDRAVGVEFNTGRISSNSKFSNEHSAKIDFDVSVEEIRKNLENRLRSSNPAQMQNEIVANSLLNIMHEKTGNYGGANPSIDFSEKLTLFYYEGMNRKTKRLNYMFSQWMKGQDISHLDLLDTILDIAGYGILGIGDFGKELQTGIQMLDEDDA